MSDPYQIGSDVEWLRHNHDELARQVKQCRRQASRWRSLCLGLLLAGGWVVYRYAQIQPVETLWQVDWSRLKEHWSGSETNAAEKAPR
jgi:hypothetical protein